MTRNNPEYTITVRFTTDERRTATEVQPRTFFVVDVERMAKRLGVHHEITNWSRESGSPYEYRIYTVRGYSVACAFIRGVRALSRSNRVTRRVLVTGYITKAPATKLVVR